MVLTKNSANAFAPPAVCCVAATGMTGGCSPGLVFGPVRGTSAGIVGLGGVDGPVDSLDAGGETGEVAGTVADVVGPVVFGAAAELVQPATSSVRNAVNAPLRRTAKSCRTVLPETRPNTRPVD